MKVEEAKTKVCPFIQKAGFVKSGLNHQNESVQEKFLKDERASNIKCICGDCMAWVYIKKDSNDFMTITSKSKEYTEEGYCARIGQ